MLSGNDYLGLAHHPKVKEAAKQALEEWEPAPLVQDWRMEENIPPETGRKIGSFHWERSLPCFFRRLRHVLLRLPDLPTEKTFSSLTKTYTPLLSGID